MLVGRPEPYSIILRWQCCGAAKIGAEVGTGAGQDIGNDEVIETRILASRQRHHNRYAPAPRPAGKPKKRAEKKKNIRGFCRFCGNFPKNIAGVKIRRCRQAVDRNEVIRESAAFRRRKRTRQEKRQYNGCSETSPARRWQTRRSGSWAQGSAPRQFQKQPAEPTIRPKVIGRPI
jgi:hypothetical protein